MLLPLSQASDIFDHSKTDPVQLDTTKLNCLLYADDLVLLSESENQSINHPTFEYIQIASVFILVFLGVSAS